MATTTKFFGPPGTGKTHKAMELFDEELHSVHPTRIGFFTFTRSGRDEALARILDRFNIPRKELTFVSTIHRTCKQVCNIPSDSVLNKTRIKQFGDEVGYDINGSQYTDTGQLVYNEKPTEADEVLQAYEIARKRMSDDPLAAYKAYEGTWGLALFKSIIENFKAWKENNDLFDFTDFLTFYLKHGETLPIEVCFIDEAQDLSPLEAAVVRKMAANAKRMYLFGDDDQSIYTFSGATSSVFLNWPADREIVLDYSHRLPRKVKDYASERIISKVKSRKVKEFRARDEEGSVSVAVNAIDAVTKGTFILYRNRYMAEDVVTDLKKSNIPYKGAGSPLDSRKVIQAMKTFSLLQEGAQVRGTDVIAMLDYAVVRGNDHLLLGAKAKLNTMYDKSRLLTIADLVDFGIVNFAEADMGTFLIKMPSVEYLVRIYNRYGRRLLEEPPKVELMTLHQSKGREAERVILLSGMAKRSHVEFVTKPDDTHRLYYVGVTRAKQEIVLVNSRTRRQYAFP